MSNLLSKVLPCFTLYIASHHRGPYLLLSQAGHHGRPHQPGQIWRAYRLYPPNPIVVLNFLVAKKEGGFKAWINCLPVLSGYPSSVLRMVNLRLSYPNYGGQLAGRGISYRLYEEPKSQKKDLGVMFQ